ncbi:hypothetical protein ACHAWO_011525 [Cyclotella atomus]|uniref:Uncharacterized protein n=1 Tax=Cyclotella atomus TaxID=382360 RepID=A0ABD3MRA1_9STRA
MNYHPNHYNSIRQFMETQQQSNQSDSDAAGNVSVLINLMDPDDETVDHTRLTHQEITALRKSDPFTYFSIMVAQQGISSYCDLDSLTEEPQTAGAAGHADAGAGGVQVRSNGAVYDRNENHSFHGGAPLRTNIRQRIMRRSSMPNLAASTIQDNHHVPTSNEVKRRRRFATETDACTALLHLARLENVDLLV